MQRILKILAATLTLAATPASAQTDVNMLLGAGSPLPQAMAWLNYATQPTASDGEAVELKRQLAELIGVEPKSISASMVRMWLMDRADAQQGQLSEEQQQALAEIFCHVGLEYDRTMMNVIERLKTQHPFMACFGKDE